jgi:hypothetical protein
MKRMKQILTLVVPLHEPTWATGSRAIETNKTSARKVRPLERFSTFKKAGCGSGSTDSLATEGL